MTLNISSIHGFSQKHHLIVQKIYLNKPMKIQSNYLIPKNGIFSRMVNDVEELLKKII